jgi:hypothetical protein
VIFRGESLKCKTTFVKLNRKLVPKCGFRFRGRESDQVEQKIGFSKSGPQNHNFMIFGGEKFGLSRCAFGKCEITLVNQLSILFHKCGLRFSGFAAEDHVPP